MFSPQSSWYVPSSTLLEATGWVSDGLYTIGYCNQPRCPFTHDDREWLNKRNQFLQQAPSPNLGIQTPQQQQQYQSYPGMAGISPNPQMQNSGFHQYPVDRQNNSNSYHVPDRVMQNGLTDVYNERMNYGRGTKVRVCLIGYLS